MNKKIKIIDLFNKRARKEQMPYKIEYGGEEYQLEDFMYINTETKRSLGEDFDLELCLLNEVEILEDNTEEIEELPINDTDKKLYSPVILDNRLKINEIIKYIRRKEKENNG